MAIPTTYTGMNAGQAPQIGGSPTLSAVQRGGERLVGAKREETKYLQEQEQQFLQASDIDPIQVASQKVLSTQASKIDDYQDKWADIMNQRQGKLTSQDKAAMAADKRQLNAWQASYQAEYDQYLSDTESFNPQKHDMNDFTQRSAEYIATGKMPAGGLLTPRAYNYNEFIKGASLVAKSRPWDESTVEVGGVLETQTVSPWSREPDEGRRAFASYVFSDEQATKAAINIFSDLDPVIKDRYLNEANVNGGDIDQVEENNAIINALWDREGRDIFLASQTKSKPKSEPYWRYRQEQETPKAVVENVVKSGGGSGMQQGTSFLYAPEGYSSTYLGTDVGGIGFDYSGVTSDRRAWTTIPFNTLVDKPEGVVADENGNIKARPMLSKGGMVEWVAQTRVREEVDQMEYLQKPRKGDGSYVQKQEGGRTKYYFFEDKQVPITTYYSDTKSRIEVMFPGFNALYNDRVNQGGGQSKKTVTSSDLSKYGGTKVN